MNQKKRLGSGLEKKVVAEALKEGIEAKLQPLSGQLQDYPGDVVLGDDILVECKVRATHVTTNNVRCITLDLHWLDKICTQARKLHKEIGIVCVRPKSSSRIVVLLEYNDFLQIINKKLIKDS